MKMIGCPARAAAMALCVIVAAVLPSFVAASQLRSAYGAAVAARGELEAKSEAHLGAWCNRTLPAQKNRRVALERLLAATQQAGDGSEAPPQSLVQEVATVGSALERQRMAGEAARAAREQKLTTAKLDMEDLLVEIKVSKAALAQLPASSKNDEGHRALQKLLETTEAAMRAQQNPKKMQLLQVEEEGTDANSEAKLETEYHEKKDEIAQLRRQHFTSARSLEVLTSALEAESAYLANVEVLCDMNKDVSEDTDNKFMPELAKAVAAAAVERTSTTVAPVPVATQAPMAPVVPVIPAAPVFVAAPVVPAALVIPAAPAAPVQPKVAPAVLTAVAAVQVKDDFDKMGDTFEDEEKAEFGIASAPAGPAAAVAVAPPTTAAPVAPVAVRKPMPTAAPVVAAPVAVAPVVATRPPRAPPSTTVAPVAAEVDVPEPTESPAVALAASVTAPPASTAVPVVAAPKPAAHKAPVLVQDDEDDDGPIEMPTAKPAAAAPVTTAAPVVSAAPKPPSPQAVAATSAAPALVDDSDSDSDSLDATATTQAPKKMSKKRHGKKAKDEDEDFVLPTEAPSYKVWRPDGSTVDASTIHTHTDILSGGSPASRMKAMFSDEGDDSDVDKVAAAVTAKAAASPKKHAKAVTTPRPAATTVAATTVAAPVALAESSDDDDAAPAPPVKAPKHKAPVLAQDDEDDDAFAAPAAKPAAPPATTAAPALSADDSDSDDAAPVVATTRRARAKKLAVTTAAPVMDGDDDDSPPPAPKPVRHVAPPPPPVAEDDDDSAITAPPPPRPMRHHAPPPPQDDDDDSAITAPPPPRPMAHQAPVLENDDDDITADPSSRPVRHLPPPPTRQVDDAQDDDTAPPPPMHTKAVAEDDDDAEVAALENQMVTKPAAPKPSKKKKKAVLVQANPEDADTGLPGQPSQYTSWTPAAAAPKKKDANFNKMMADLTGDDDDDAAAVATTAAPHHHHKKQKAKVKPVVATTPAPKPVAKSSDDDDDANVVYDDDDLPKHKAMPMNLEFQGGWRSLMQKQKKAPPKLDGEVAILNNLYADNGALPNQYKAWHPGGGATTAAPAARGDDDGSDDGGGGGGGGGDDSSGGDDASFLQVVSARSHLRGGVPAVSRAVAATTLLQKYADNLKSTALAQAVKAKPTVEKLEALLQKLQATDPLEHGVPPVAEHKVGAHREQAEEWCAYFQQHAASAEPLRRAVSAAENATDALEEADARNAALIEESEARTQMQKTVEQDVKSLKELLSAEQEGLTTSSLDHLVEGGATAAVAQAAEATEGLRSAHKQLGEVLGSMLRQRSAVAEDQKAKLLQLEQATKSAEKDLASKKVAAAQSKAALEAARSKLSTIRASCDTALVGFERQRHAGHMEVVAVETALTVLQA
jgi:hypothetical protein